MNPVFPEEKYCIWAGVKSLKALIPLVQEAVKKIGMDLRSSTLDDLDILATISWLCGEFQTIYWGIGGEKQIDPTQKYRVFHPKIRNSPYSTLKLILVNCYVVL